MRWKKGFLLVGLALAAGDGGVRATPVEERVEEHHLPGQRPEPRQQSSCSGSGPVQSSPGTWWRAQIGHNGTTPYSTDKSFQYYRTATQYGADNTGVRDASDAINAAINAWSRTGKTVTTHPAYVYIPPGRYRIQKSVQMLVSTYLVGDPLNLPILIADVELNGPVINGFDSHQGDGSPTKNFYMAVRNLKIDTSELASNASAVAVDWSVSQACSFANVHIAMPPASGHIGLTMKEGGSGIIISDSTFSGGAVGISMTGQQYLFKGLQFRGCAVGISLQHAFVAVLQDIVVSDCHFAVDMGGDGVGAVSVVDSSVSNCFAGVNTRVSGGAHGSLVLDNFRFSGSSSTTVRDAADGKALLEGSVAEGQTWVMGNANPDGYQAGRTYPINRPTALLVSGGKYFTAPTPQYEKYDVGQFASVTEDPDLKVYGDNVHDDGPAINAILKKHAGCKIVFFPQGVYLTRETIYVPPGSRIIGEVLSTISGSGSKFADADNPQPVLKLGDPGEKGVAQVTDILITVADVLPGAILTQVNMAGDKPGDVGMWHCVYRVGGSADSLTGTKCADSDPAGCKAAFALVHVTKTASAYLEGVWGWVADHGLDPNLPAQNLAVGRGLLVESTAPSWFVGTSFEHCVLYQYSLVGASNVYMSLEQTEAPYWHGKGTPQRAPAPWSVNTAFGDPNFANCATQNAGSDDQCFRAWGHYMSNSSQVVIHGSALWTFFNAMNDNQWRDPHCDATGSICQLNMAYTSQSRSVFWYSASSKSTANLIFDDDDNSVAAQSQNQGSWPPRGAVVAAYLRRADPIGKAGEGEPGNQQGQDSGAAALARGGVRPAAAGIPGLVVNGAALLFFMV